MRNKIFMYLFLFAALYIVFQYMNAKKADEFYTEKVKSLETKVGNMESKLDSLKLENEVLFQQKMDLRYFSLTENDAASSIFVKRGFDVNELAARVKDEIISRNDAKKDNDLVPFPGMNGLMRINHIQILNSQWIIADFTNGSFWGEVLLKYHIDDDGKLEITTMDALLY